jgi:hypothetical protein
MPKREQTESVFEHDFNARVNKEGDHHEVILTSADSKTPLSIVMRNQTGTKGFEDGGTYRATFSAVSVPTKEERAAQMAGMPVEPPKEDAGE